MQIPDLRRFYFIGLPALIWTGGGYLAGRERNKTTGSNRRHLQP